jgi:hypothetical protein
MTQVIAEATRIGGSNRLMPMKETAALLGISYYTLKTGYPTMGIPYIRQGTRVYFRERSVLAWIEAKERSSS